MNSGTALSSRPGSWRSFSYSAGCWLSASRPPVIEWRVVSLPATIKEDDVVEVALRIVVAVGGRLLAKSEIRSRPGLVAGAVVPQRHELAEDRHTFRPGGPSSPPGRRRGRTAACRRSAAAPAAPRTGSRTGSPASGCQLDRHLVDEVESLAIGSSSRIWAARNGSTAPARPSAGVEKIGETARRWSSWRGGSIEMKLVRSSAKSAWVADSGGRNQGDSAVHGTTTRGGGCRHRRRRCRCSASATNRGRIRCRRCSAPGPQRASRSNQGHSVSEVKCSMSCSWKSSSGVA